MTGSAVMTPVLGRRLDEASLGPSEFLRWHPAALLSPRDQKPEFLNCPSSGSGQTITMLKISGFAMNKFDRRVSMPEFNSWLLRVFMAWCFMIWPSLVGAESPGGWVETLVAGVRDKLSAEQIRSFVPPSRGAFTFPAPYHTRAVRITDPSDCGGASDCLNYVGYSYWRNTNNHTGSHDMLLFLSFDRRRGGAGPTLFRYDKTKDTITKVGPLFSPISKFSWSTGEGWYFSATKPNKLYVNDGPKMLRYDVVSHLFDTVFDVTAMWGHDKYIWQMHSSNDDTVHSATLRIESTGEMLGCVVYNEHQKHLSFFPKIGIFNECHVDKSGRWLMSIEDIDGRYKDDMRIFDLSTNRE